MSEDGQARDDLVRRLAKRRKHLSRWLKREGIECFRLYDRDLPQYPAVVDVYGERVHVQEFTAGSAEGDEDGRRSDRTRTLLEAVAAELDVEPDAIVLKERRRQTRGAQYTRLDRSRDDFLVRESGLRFLVNLRDHLDAGLFLDHRTTRARVRESAEGARVLNLFCYTGSFTVYAVAGGARMTTSVDLSTTYIEWARRNLELNELDGPKHHFITADCLQWLDEAVKERHQRGSYDIIVLDPPTFSSSKKMEQVFDVQKQHVALIEQCMSLLSPAGTLWFSTNLRRFTLDHEALKRFQVRDITQATTPKDFEGRTPHAGFCLRHRSD